jgi:alpha-glucosidase
MTNRVLPHISATSLDGPAYVFSGPDGASCRVTGIASDTARVELLTQPFEDWARAVPAADVVPARTVTHHADGVRLAWGPLGLEISRAPFWLRWSIDGRPLASDHPHLAYTLRQGWIRHTMTRALEDIYFGLGEVSGDLNHHYRRYRLEPTDACGYDAGWSDPLYKHWPLYLTRTPSGSYFALLYDVPCRIVVDFGAEIHHYYGPFRYAEMQAGGFEYYIVCAEALPALVGRVTDLIGRPELPPRWSLGYLHSGMAYADDADPEAALVRFAERCRDEGIPCDGIQLGSGYTLRDGKRYVFNWNRDRIPHPERFIRQFTSRGLHVVANVKPALLTDHPDYARLAAEGGFLRDAGGAPKREGFWDGDASWPDFTQPAVRAWWKAGLTSELLAFGVEGVWNDNNEYAVGDAYAADRRPAHAALQMRWMAQASHEALREWAPDARPFVISRSASIGVQRYAQTWSGDNTTSWRTLRYNLPMGLGLALSGFAATTHDAGGFFGDAPTPELFVRWIQQAIFHPRFYMNSWKTPPTEPWMYPEVFAFVREAIRLRYRLRPYLYGLFVEHTRTGVPIHRPLVYAFPDDARCLEESSAFLLGPSLLVPGVFEPGVRRARMYLPGSAGWYSFDQVRYFAAGDREVPLPLERPPVLARAGSLVPLGGAAAPAPDETSERREMRVFPYVGRGVAEHVLYEDDGTSMQYTRGGYSELRVRMTCEEARIVLGIAFGHVGYPLPYREITFRLPPGEGRPAVLEGALEMRDAGIHGEGWHYVTAAILR